MTISIRANTTTESAITTNGAESVVIDATKIKFNLPITDTAGNTFSPASVFAADTGASLIGFKQSGTGAVSRTVKQKLEETPSSLDYGHTVSSDTPYPYTTPLPVDVVRGDPWEKFSVTLAKVLNFTDYPNFKLNQRARAAFNSGTVRISVVGDSITAGADNWRSNTYITLLKTQLKQTFPWVGFELSNYAIGGMSAGTLANPSYVGATSLGSFSLGTNYWFTPNVGGACTNNTYAATGYAHLDEENWPLGSTAGKSWRQEISDSNPDIIVYAFGMNDGTDYDAFKTAYDSFQSFIATSMAANPPWFVLVSCFLPSKIPPAGQPHAAWQIPAQAMSDALKYWASQSGYGLIDANSVFNFLRDGIRREYIPYTHESNWRYAGDASKWSWQSGFSYDSGAVRAGGTGMALRVVATRDIDVSATFEVGSFAANKLVARIGYRDALGTTAGAPTGYSADIVVDNTSTSALVDLYYDNTVKASKTFSIGATPVAGYKFSIKVKVYGDRHEIWLNGKLVIDFSDPHSLYSGSLQIGIPQGAGYVSDLGLSYAPQWAESPSHVDKKWLLGTPVYDGSGNFQAFGDFITNPDSMGGNVVNHPTAWGYNTFYGFGVSKFVNELKQRVNTSISIHKESSASFTNTAAINTPQVVSTIPTITLKAPPSTSGANFLVTLHIPYTITGAIAHPQIGLTINGTHANSSYVPQASTLDVAVLEFLVKVGVGVTTIQVDCTRSALTETLTVNPIGGTLATIRVQEITL